MLQEIKVSLDPTFPQVSRTFVSEPLSLLSGFHFSSPLPQKASLIKCALSKNDHISHVVFFAADYFFPPPPFVKGLDERSPMKMKGLDAVLPWVPGEHTAKEGGKIYIYSWRKIFLRVLVYMPRDFSRDSNFDI